MPVKREIQALPEPQRLKRKCVIALFCVCGAAANWGLNTVVSEVLGIPLFVDTVFTLAITFAAGPLAGILTGILFAVLDYLLIFGPKEWSFLLYTICSAAAVLLTWAFDRRFHLMAGDMGGDFQTRFIRVTAALFLLSAIMCIVISVLGGIIAWAITDVFHHPQHADPASYFSLGLLWNKLPILAVNILARIPVNILDRPVSVFAAYGIALLFRRGR